MSYFFDNFDTTSEELSVQLCRKIKYIESDNLVKFNPLSNPRASVALNCTNSKCHMYFQEMVTTTPGVDGIFINCINFNPIAQMKYLLDVG